MALQMPSVLVEDGKRVGGGWISDGRRVDHHEEWQPGR